MCLFSCWQSILANEMHFGVQASRNAIQTMKEWDGMQKYLETETGIKVNLVPLNPAQTLGAIRTGQIDMMLANPVLAFTLQVRDGYKPILTQLSQAGPYFAGVIFVRKDSDLHEVADLKGRKVMAFKFKSAAAAYVFQVKHLLDKGIDAHKEFSDFREARTQDDIVFAVQAGVMDAGFIKAGLLETMSKEGKVKFDDFRVLDKVEGKYLYAHTTKLYPDWTLMVNPKYDAQNIVKIKAALVKLNASHPACKAANIHGFTDPLSLDEMGIALKALKLPPYDR